MCGAPRFADETEDALLNPSCIFEVLSESTEAYDRGRKFEFYRALESVKEVVLVGTDASAELSWSSACHGAGRAMSRSAAKSKVNGNALRKELEKKGILVRCASAQELAEEAPVAYKDVDRVVGALEESGIAKRVVRLVPLGVLKG
mgnify:CR=1 FL=1